MKSKKSVSGFTIVEMGIVVSIVALGVAAVTGGSFLINQARLRAVITEVSDIKFALATFDARMRALPGDMDTATSYWAGSVTANGNGNRHIEFNGTVGANNESFRAWQQLSMLGLIKGNYAGVDTRTGTVTGQQSQIGINVPRSQYAQGKAGYTFQYTNWNGNPVSNMIIFGSEHTDTLTNNSVIPPADAMTIDKKIDDGKPGTGLVWTQAGSNGANCITTPNSTTSTYILSTTTSECRMAFIYDTGK